MAKCTYGRWNGWPLGKVSNVRTVFSERFRPPTQKGQPAADKIMVLVFIAGYVGLIPWIW